MTPTAAEHFHQKAIAKAKERAATIEADYLASQQGAAEHLKTTTITTAKEAEEPNASG